MRALISNVEEILCALIFLAMTLLGFANIVVRYLTNRSFASTEELLINGFLLLTVLGASVAAKRGDHLAVTILFNLLPGRGKIVLVAVSTVLGVLLLAAAAWYTAELVSNQLASGMLSYALRIPAWYYSIGVPIAFLLVMLRFVQHAARTVRGLRADADMDGTGAGAGGRGRDA
ncbi:MAG TPA: TRAP transporter small permease subunit [Arenibaculum sp.]|nr:TRAP transporter small permease subunit [Arenibaculum sp.]